MTGRDHRIDFLRGIALLMIFLDHVPWNPLTLLTLRTWSFADAAELFFFLSGYIAALVYGKVMTEHGFAAATARIYRRAWDIYVTQMVLLVGLVALLPRLARSNPLILGYFHIDQFLRNADTLALQALLLRYQPTFLDILPIYITFFAVLPLVLFLLRERVWIALALSFAVYLGVQIWGWIPVTKPDNSPWLFNPLAWQFIFVLGAVFGSGAASRLIPILKSRWMFWLAVVIALPPALINGSVAIQDFLPWMPAIHMTWPQTDKSQMQFMRLISFFALALIVWRIMPPSDTLKNSAVAQTVLRCGRNSLSIFAAGCFLAAAADVICEPWPSLTARVLANMAGIGLLLAFAALLEWMGRAGRHKAQLNYAGAT